MTLLRTAATEGDNEPVLLRMADHLAAVRHSSPEFQRLLATVREALPSRFRGEYGTKLALVDRSTDQLLLSHPETDAAVEIYLREAPDSDEERRAALSDAVHPFRRTEPLHCTDCHRAEGELLNFAAAGYPPARVQMLSAPIVFRMVQNIAEGQPFYMPGFVTPPEEPQNAPPGSQHP